MAVTALEMALAIEKRPERDSIESFVRREFASEQMSTFAEAIEICYERARIMGQFESLLDALEPVQESDVTIEALIKRRRAQGYDSEFEAIVTRQWVCPHCQFRGTIVDALLPIGDPDHMPACRACGREGIAPIEDDPPELDVIDGGKRAIGSRKIG